MQITTKQKHKGGVLIMQNKKQILNSNMTPYHIYIEIDWDTVEDELIEKIEDKTNNYGVGDYTFSAYMHDLLYSENNNYQEEKDSFLSFIDMLNKNKINYSINTDTKTLKNKQSVIEEINNMELSQINKD